MSFEGWVFQVMSFILVPSQGEDLQVNAWNWRPILALLFAAGVITKQDHDLMGSQGCGGRVDANKAARIADVVTRKVNGMNPGERMLTVYSTTFEWLETFAKFCRSSGGFEVM